MEKKFFKKLPAVHQTDVQKKFFDATFEQLFSKKNSSKFDGFIGRRVSGNYNPVKDYYLPEINKDRTWYQLEPVTVSTDPVTLAESNVNFYTDLINYIKKAGGLTGNHDRLFSGKVYSFAPPIDIDKFINYQNYIWMPSKLSPIVIDSIDDAVIEASIVGSDSYTVTTGSATGLEFISGIRVTFPSSSSYNRTYTVEDVGQSIRLVADEIEILASTQLTPLPWGADATSSGIDLNNLIWGDAPWGAIETASSAQDYITIQRGSFDSNLWSRTNKWFHITAVERTVEFTGEVIPSIAVRADRPIIEFRYNLELDRFGTHFLSDVDIISGNFATDTTALLSDIEGQTLASIRLLPGFSEIDAGSRILFATDISPTSAGLVSEYVWVVSVGSGDVISLSPLGYSQLASGSTITSDASVYTTSAATYQLNTSAGSTVKFAMAQENLVSLTSALPIVDADSNVLLQPVTISKSATITHSGSSYVLIDTPYFENHATAQSCVLVVDGTSRQFGGNLGRFFNYRTGVWTESSNQKVKQNQPPLFALYTSSREYLGDLDVFPFSDFSGNKVFSYAVDESVTAVNDRILDFPLLYRGSAQGSDIIFENNLESDVYQYLSGSALTPITGYYNYRLVSAVDSEIDAGTWLFNNSWHITSTASRQYVIDKYAGTSGVNEYPISVWPVDVDRGVLAYVSGTEYTDLTVFSKNGQPWVHINNVVITDDDDVEIRTYSYDSLPASSTGFFEIPLALEANAISDEVSQITYGEINPHFLTIIANQPEAESDPRARNNNFINSSKDLSLGTRILQTESPLVKTMFMTSESGTDLLSAIDYARREYTMFKSQFLSAAYRINPVVTNMSDTLWLSQWLTSTIASVNKSKVFSDAFKLSSMYPLSDPSVSVIISPALSTVTVDINSVEVNRPYIIDNTDIAFIDSKFAEIAIYDSGASLIPASDYTLRKFDNSVVITFTDPALSEENLVVSASICRADVTEVAFDVTSPNNYMYIFDVSISGGVYTKQNRLLAGVDYDVSYNGYVTVYSPVSTAGLTLVCNAYEKSLPSYIPATPSKLGLYPVFTPGLVVDTAGVKPRAVIVGHDGSKVAAFSKYQVDITGNIITDINGVPFPEGLSTAAPVFSNTLDTLVRYFDIRDLLLLEYEKSVYSSIDPEFKSERGLGFPIASVSPSPFRPEELCRYSHSELVTISSPTIAKWCSTFKLDLYTNETYDPVNWKTYNYSTNFIRKWDIDLQLWVETQDYMPGHWRGIYQYYYDTVSPNTTPWEMLGFSEKPTWWDVADDNGDQFVGYGGNYTETNVAMWADLEQGIIRRGPRQGVDPLYARPGLTGASGLNLVPEYQSQLLLRAPYTGLVASNHIIPVSGSDILSPMMVFSLSEYNDLSWRIGDRSPVENIWAESSEFAFSQIVFMFLMKPAQFGEQLWDTKVKQMAYGQIIDKTTGKRASSTDYLVHSELDSAGSAVVNYGYQQYVSDYLNFNKVNVTSVFGNRYRALSVRLGYKMAGFVNSDTTRLYLESSTNLQSTGDLLIPSTNYDILLHTGSPIRTYSYSGVVIRITDDGYKVHGYDLDNLSFQFYPADLNSPAYRITEGGVPESFIEYAFGVTYSAGTIVRYNGRFFISNKLVTATTFNRSDWDSLSELPIKGGVSATYYPARLATPITVPYGHVFSSVQDLYDFLIGYGAYLSDQGWQFTDTSDDGVVESWKTYGSRLLFWLTSNRTDGEAFLISPQSTALTLIVEHGYPDMIERLNNGVYSIVDKYGSAISPSLTFVDREDKRITVMTESIGVYGLKIDVSETEHVLLVDQVSDFNDVIYSPLLRSRQGRLRIGCTRSNDWFGKLEAQGYLIVGNRLLQNTDNLVDSIDEFYSDVNTLDNPMISAAARRLIGYDQKEYLDRLGVSDDVQFNFYQGHLRQKGTLNAVSKILRSNRISNKDQIDIFEEWAVNLSTYGGSEETVSIEFTSKFEKVKTDPQQYRMNFVANGNMFIDSIDIYNAVEVYDGVPAIVITGGNPTEAASAVAILGSDRRLSKIVVTSKGAGFTSSPTVTISGSFLETADSEYDSLGNLVNRDNIYAVMKRSVLKTDSPYDNVIDIDINDTDTWLYSSTSSLGGTVPVVTRENYNMPVAGYVSRHDVDIEVFEDITSITENPILSPDSIVHVANDIYGDWDVFRFVVSDITISQANGYFVATTTPSTFSGSSVYQRSIAYTSSRFNPDLSLDTGFIMIGTSVYRLNDLDGELVVCNNAGEPVKELTLVDGNLVSLPVYVLHSLRFKSEDELAAVDPSVIAGKMVYIDNSDLYDGNWVVMLDGNVVRRNAAKIDTSLFESVTLSTAESGNVAVLPVYDPSKGILPNVVDINVAYKSFQDPARYSNSSDLRLVDDQRKFSDSEVGKVWLDLSSFKFYDYELAKSVSETDDDIAEYRRSNWGKIFTGSRVDVYEWISSNVPPSQYAGPGIPKNTTDYTEVITYNPALREYEVSYYFWVKGIDTVPATEGRTASVMSIRNLILNPSAYRYSYFAPISFNESSIDIVIGNADHMIGRRNFTVEIQYKSTVETQQRHTDWQLLSASRFSDFPVFLWQRLADSLAGFTVPIDINFSGAFAQVDGLKSLPVPNPTVSEIDKYGLGIRPQQTMFKDKMSAREVVCGKVNTELATMQLWLPVYGDWQALLANTSYWNLVDWYADGFDASNSIASRQVNDTADLLAIESELSDGELVRVYPFAPGLTDVYEVYQYKDSSFTLIRRQNGTMAIDLAIASATQSSDATRAIHTLYDVLYNNIFIGADSGKVQAVFFSALHYSLSEQKNLTWAFKTSYISVVQEGKELDQPLFLRPEQLDEYVSYVNDVKPYHTKIRDVYVTYGTSDIVNGNVLDNYIGTYDPVSNIASANFVALRSFAIKILFADFGNAEQVITPEVGWGIGQWGTAEQAFTVSPGVTIPAGVLGWGAAYSLLPIVSSESDDLVVDAMGNTGSELVPISPTESVVMYVTNDVTEVGMWGDDVWSGSWGGEEVDSTVNYIMHANYSQAYPNINRSYYAINADHSATLINNLENSTTDVFVALTGSIQESGDHALWAGAELIKYSGISRSFDIPDNSDPSYVFASAPDGITVQIGATVYPLYRLNEVQRAWNSTGYVLHSAGDLVYDSSYDITADAEKVRISGIEVLAGAWGGLPWGYEHNWGTMSDSELENSSQVTTTDNNYYVPITNPWFTIENYGPGTRLVASTGFSRRLFIK